MKASSLDTWIWVLIYGGLIAAVLGSFVTPRDAALGSLLLLGGTGVVVLGALLIWVRSRMKDKP